MPQGFEENKSAARTGGTVAGNARKELESKTGNKVITNNNHLEHFKNQLVQEISE